MFKMDVNIFFLRGKHVTCSGTELVEGKRGKELGVTCLWGENGLKAIFGLRQRRRNFRFIRQNVKVRLSAFSKKKTTNRSSNDLF